MSILLARKIASGIQKDYDLTEDDMDLVWGACVLLSSDPDGCVVHLEDDAGITIDYEDIEKLCDAIDG